MKETIIEPNLQYLTDITRRAHENSQIIIRYHWKRYLARKAAKKAKKAAATAAANQKNKFGGRSTNASKNKNKK